jgi:DNA-binding GntR family transcriptional regulator
LYAFVDMRRQSGGGAETATRRPASRISSSTELPTSERAYRAIKEAIVSGELPADSRLVELALAADLGVSRTPVREALKRLVAEDLVVVDPVRGMIVKPIDHQEVEDFYTIREVLEGLAARLAAQRISGEQLIRLGALVDAMQAAAESGDGAALVQANILFHETIFQATANQRLLSLGRGLSDFVRRLSSVAFSDPRRDREVAVEHRAILEALERRDAEAAELRAREHMAHARSHFVRQSAFADLR